MVDLEKKYLLNFYLKDYRLKILGTIYISVQNFLATNKFVPNKFLSEWRPSRMIIPFRNKDAEIFAYQEEPWE